jgi:hypothetical protein
MLGQVLDGTMDGHLWDYFTSIHLGHDPLLELIQTECWTLCQDTYLAGAVRTHLFHERGLQEIRRLLAMPELAGRWHTACQPLHDA